MSFSTTTIPANVSLIPVDTRNIPRVLYLPTVSTNMGRTLIFKDYYGATVASSFTISTIGKDLIDDYNYMYTFSNAYGTLELISDGSLSWRIMGIYNGLLTPQYNSIPIVTSGLVNNVDAATYSSGTTLVALLGNNQTLYNTPTTTTTPGGSNAIVFNGSSYGIDTTGIATTSIQSFTMDIWFNAAANVSGSVIGELGQNSQGGWSITMIGISGNIIYVGFWQGSVYQLNLGTYAANTWTHVSYTYSSSTVIGYVNGVYVATGSSTKQWPTNAYYGLACSTNPYTNLAGAIGAYKLYNRVLTATEIKQNYNSLAIRFGRSLI